MKLPLSGQHCLLFMAIAFCICLFLSPYMFYAINCLQVSLLRAGTALYSLLVYFTWVIFLFFFFSCAHFIRRAYLCVCLVTQSYLTLGDPMDCSPPGSSVRGDSPGKNTGVGCHALLQGIFPTQGSNPSLPYCRWILYQLSHKESQRILEWVAYPFSSKSSQPRNQTGVSCIAGRFF